MAEFNRQYWTRSRAYYKGRITFFDHKLEEAGGEITLAELEVIKNRSNQIRDGFEAAQTEIEMNIVDEPNEILQRVEFDNAFYDLERRVMQLILIKRGENTAVNSRRHVKLPDIAIPKYNGDVTQWLSYKHSFTKLIGEKDLDDVTKFQYLESSLIGSKAHDLIRSITNSDFQTAWSRLVDEYDNTTIIIEKHLKGLYDATVQRKDDAESLQKFLDIVEINLAALASLEAPIHEWDMLLVYHLSTRLDPNSRKELEKVKQVDSLLSFNEFREFIKARIRLLHAIAKIQPSTPLATSTPKPEMTHHKESRIKSRSFVSQAENQSQSGKCQYCQGSHKVTNCAELKEQTVEERTRNIKEKGLCFNCLRKGHTVAQCESKGRCHECKKKHHTALHIDTNQSSSKESLDPKPSTSTSVALSAISQHHTSVVLLATAVVLIKSYRGEFVVCRALLDGASTSNFITEELAQKLGLKKRFAMMTVGGINNTATTNKYQVTTEIKSRVSKYKVDLDFLVSKKITGELPTVQIDTTNWQLPPSEDLADPHFSKPEPVDLLLSSEVFYEIISGDKRQIGPKMFIFSSEFGYIIAGKHIESVNPLNSYSYCSIADLKQQIQRFWELESLDSTQNMSPEEKAAEAHFTQNVQRSNDGRYSVALPLNSNVSKLGDSKKKSRQLFLASESRLVNNPEKYKHYREFMTEMLSLNHMEEASEDSEIQNYFVHHMVTRPLSTTTKYRVVFNASFRTSTNYSLNDALLVGPTIQDDVFTHLLQWRKYPVALIGDIEKMYRQILIHEKDRDFQRIWWRDSINQELKSYRMRTVTYGTASAPFQAVRTLKQLADDEYESYPEAVQILRNNFYVDDFIGSFESASTAITMKQSLTNLLKTGGFILRKWASNVKRIVPDSENTADILSVLGVKWNRDLDHIVLPFNEIKLHDKITKSTMLSEIAQFFDPLGLCSPVIVIAKLAMQRLWSDLSVSWTDELPEDFKNHWNDFRNEIKLMKPISTYRCVIPYPKERIEIHGFSDACEYAYGACIYIRNIGQSEISNRLLCAKSRVAPLKKQTIPRLELCAALLLSQLIKKVNKVFKLPDSQIYLWTDSEITLYRIKSNVHSYCTFVGTRIAQIQENTLASNWNHIPTKINPADVVSRGLTPHELQNTDIWWFGPKFLYSAEETWPTQTKFDVVEDLQEIKKYEKSFVVQNIDDRILLRSSSLEKLIGVVATIIRFSLNARKSRKYRSFEAFNVAERQDALFRIIRIIQSITYSEELNLMKKAKPLSNSSKLKSLNPFIDENGIIRVGGRLENSKLSYENQHQIVIPSNHHVALLLVVDVHEKNMHCGPQTLLNTVRQEFWIIGGRSLCKKVVHSCLICFRRKPIMLKQIMGQIPEYRLKPHRAFQIVGIDYAGPFSIKYQIRTKVNTKAYVCLFTCCVTRATHLEIVHDLTTESFLACFKRFISRRGIPNHIYSDNATNFTGANRQLKLLREAFMNQTHIKKVLEFCFIQSIQWHFIPPRSPHFGSLWESIVKQAKYHLTRSTKDQHFTTEQLDTIICQVECCLNSRPLTPISDDIDDLKALTPGHFLIGQPLNALPEPNFLCLKFDRLSLWKKIQYIVQKFWNHWQRDYINELQQRFKWTKQNENVKCGSLVLLHEDGLPPTYWLLGRIIEIHPGKDNITRVVTIKTIKGNFNRSITKIAPLPLDNFNDKY